MAPTTAILYSSGRGLAHPYRSPSSAPSCPVELDIHARLLAQAPEFRVLLCGYRSKVCLKHRARKRDGSLHRFCEDHRQRANQTQKKWAQRRFSLVRDMDALGATGAVSDEAIASQRVDGYVPLLLDTSATSEDATTMSCSSRSTPEAHDEDALWQSLELPELADAVEYSF